MSGKQTCDLTKVHEANLKMIKEIDRICRKYKIRYALDSGTLLGAVRHKGFIPWDDDADVTFTRSQYELFVKVVRRELPKGMTFVEPNEYHGGKAFYDFIPRILYDNSRKFQESGKMAFYDDKISRLCVDIFIQDALPEGEFAKRWTKLVQSAVYGLALGHRWRIDYSDYQGMMKAFVFVLSTVGRLIPFRVTCGLQRRICLKDRKKKTGLYYYTNYAPNWFYVEMKREWSDRVLEAPFEDCSLFIPAGWDEFLKQVYGDYGKLPPAEKQIPEHSDMEIEIYG